MDVIIYIALAQSIIALSLIVINHSKHFFDTLLSYFFLFALVHLILKVLIMEYLNDNFLFYNFITPNNLVYPPILFLFLNNLIEKKLIRFEVLIHFSPFAIASIAYLCLGIDYLNNKNEVYISLYCNIMRVIVLSFIFLLYPILSIYKIIAHKNSLKKKKAFNLLLVSNGIFITVIILGLFVKNMENTSMFMLIYLLFVLIFVMLINLKFNLTSRIQFLEILEERANKKKYNSSKLTTNKIKSIKEELLNFKFHKSEYLSPEFNLDGFSKLINKPKHHISQVLNEELNINFQQFINSYRIEHFCEMVENNKLDDKSILDLAFECGFNSKSSFNSNFRKIKGATPTEYINVSNSESIYT